LQENEYERVGEGKSRKTDVRVIAATNRDLEKEVEVGKFRRDLFYRLSVFPIQVPSLRERMEDIAALAEHFLGRACQRFNREPLKLTQQQLRHLQQYEWPGNIRELQNVIERAVILSDSVRLRLDAAFQPAVFQHLAHKSAGSLEFLTEAEWTAQERSNVMAALRETKGKIYGPSGAAALLGVNPNTLAYRLKKLGISRTQLKTSDRS
jgi:transcriptional regulator with GAF, ATPase, and Fis domain